MYAAIYICVITVELLIVVKVSQGACLGNLIL